MPRFTKNRNRNVQEWKRDAVNIKATGVPRAMVVKFPYFEEEKAISTLANEQLNRIWRLNSIFDPYFTQNTGIVPYGVPELSTLYQEYMVLTATVAFEIQSLDNGYGTVTMHFNDSTTGIENNDDLINNVGVQNRTFNSPGAGNTNIVKMKRKFHLPDWLGRELDPSKDAAATQSTNPTQGAYLIVQWHNQASSTATFTIRTKIKYVTRLFNIPEPTNQFPE